MFLIVFLIPYISFSIDRLGLWAIDGNQIQIDHRAVEIIQLPQSSHVAPPISLAIQNHYSPQIDLKPYENILSDTPLLYDLDAQTMIQSLCDRVGQLLPLKTTNKLKCRLIVSFIPGAWSLPTGEVFMSTGLIGIMSSPDGILSVLGHEIAHILLNHHDKRSKDKKNLDDFERRLVKILNSFSRSIYSKKSINGLIEAIYRYHEREHELECDEIGILSAIIVGSDETKILKDWNRFIKIYQKLEPKKNYIEKKIYASHPDGKFRIKRMEKIIKMYPKINFWKKKNFLGEDIRQEYSIFHEKYKETIFSYINLQIKINSQK